MKNIIKTQSLLRREDFERVLNIKPITIWITGLSGSGKTTLGYLLEKQLFTINKYSKLLDGDNIRSTLNNDLGFSLEDRAENIRRISEVCKLFNDTGIITIASFISPKISDRILARKIIGQEYFFEIYLSTPLSLCEKRDPKGLYKKARKGLITDFTGVDSPYEAPISPDLIIDTSIQSLEESAASAMKLILKRIST